MLSQANRVRLTSVTFIFGSSATREPASNRHREAAFKR
jgi:hypothetical protein